MPDSDLYMTAKEAANELGIRRETLYAYVSRGWIQSKPSRTGNRKHRYLREDVERLKRRREERRQPAKVLEQALHFGGPLLDSAITLIEDGRFYYRGLDVLDLAREKTFEEVAAWIWTSSWDLPPTRIADRWPPLSEDLHRKTAERPALERLLTLLPGLGAEDLAAFDLRPNAARRTAGRVLDWMIRIVVGRLQPANDWVETLARGWRCQGERARDLLRTAVILCVDHELNVSSFTARCVASAGSSPYAVVHAGLNALQGAEHGGHTERVDALLRESGDARRIRHVMAERLRRRESIPGCGQRLYRDGDPRAKELLLKIEERFPDAVALRLGRAYSDAALELLGEYPTLDLGLVLTARALGLPAGSGLTLFALGRAVGWLGHGIEQYASQQLIRPRARYVGTLPAGRGKLEEEEG